MHGCHLRWVLFPVCLYSRLPIYSHFTYFNAVSPTHGKYFFLNIIKTHCDQISDIGVRRHSTYIYSHLLKGSRFDSLPSYSDALNGLALMLAQLFFKKLLDIFILSVGILQASMLKLSHQCL